MTNGSVDNSRENQLLIGWENTNINNNDNNNNNLKRKNQWPSILRFRTEDKQNSGNKNVITFQSPAFL